MTPTPDTVLGRGTPVLGLCLFLERELSSGARENVFRRLPAPWARRFPAGSLLASDHAPVSVVDLLTMLAAEAKGEGVEAFAEGAGAFGAKEGIATFFKAFFRVFSPANALEAAPLRWARIYDAGKMTVDSRGRHGGIRVSSFPGGPAVCDRTTGWFCCVGFLSGASNLQSRHDRSVSRGAPDCAWVFDWE